jgi:[ribosomal protein S5]-alanine N-acetyltransferase
MNNESIPVLQSLATERLVLRPLHPTDAAQIFKLRSSELVNRYTDRIPAKTLDDAKAFIAMITDKIAEDKSVYLGICVGTGPLIGTICLANIDKENNEAEIGFELLPEFQGQGIMNEAISAIIEHAKNVLKLTSVLAIVKIENERSLKLLAKNNFRATEKHPVLQENELALRLSMNDLPG